MRLAPFVALGAALALVAVVLARLLGAQSDAFPTTPAALPPRVEPSPGPQGAGALLLRADGLGDLPFGTPADAAVEQLTAQIGPPQRQPIDVWCDATDTVPVGQLTEWDESLSLLIWDGQLRGWTIDDDAGTLGDARTEVGIGIGSTVTELRDAYGDQLIVEPVDPADRTLGDLRFVVTTPGADPTHGLSGYIVGDDRTGTVTGLLGGPGPCGG